MPGNCRTLAIVIATHPPQVQPLTLNPVRIVVAGSADAGVGCDAGATVKGVGSTNCGDGVAGGRGVGGKGVAVGSGWDDWQAIAAITVSTSAANDITVVKDR